MPAPRHVATDDVRALTRHLNAIGNHAVKAESILAEFFSSSSANPQSAPELAELLVVTRTIIETWDDIATKIRGL